MKKSEPNQNSKVLKRWSVPIAHKTATASDFFLEMSKLNKDSRSFSQRELAKSLDWPASYIPDLIKGRKTFTIARALEFIQQFKVNAIDAEAIILLAVESQLKEKAPELKTIRSIRTPQVQEGYKEVPIFDFVALLTLEVVSILRGRATTAKIKDLLAKKGLPVDGVEANLEWLLNNKLIEKKRGVYRSSNLKALTMLKKLEPGVALKLQKDLIDNIKRFCDFPILPAVGSSSFVQIRKDRYADVREKILSLRNWIHEISNVDSSSDDPESVELYQFDVHFFPQFKHEDLTSVSQ